MSIAAPFGIRSLETTAAPAVHWKPLMSRPRATGLICSKIAIPIRVESLFNSRNWTAPAANCLIQQTICQFLFGNPQVYLGAFVSGEKHPDYNLTRRHSGLVLRYRLLPSAHA